MIMRLSLLLGVAATASASPKNPYEDGGCLYSRGLSTTKRMCNSHDVLPDGTVNTANCSPNLLNVPEVRLANENWESAMFVAWIAQIILSETHGIPVSIDVNSKCTVETAGDVTAFEDCGDMNFYDRGSRFGYGAGYDGFDPLVVANKDPTCETRTCKHAGDPTCSADTTHVACHHALLETWSGMNEVVESLSADIEKAGALGMVGRLGLYGSDHAMSKDPTLASYLGYKDELKMRKTFKRPLRWAEYCNHTDGVACCANATESVGCKARSAAPDDKTGSKFSAAGYTGHFVEMPVGEGGHYLQAPCGWSTFCDAQLYWNNLSLTCPAATADQSAYSYGEMQSIFDTAAAQTPPEPVVIWWWEPEAMLTKWIQTGDRNFKLNQVVFPEETAECNALRPKSGGSSDVGVAAGKCSADISIRRGKEVNGFNPGCAQAPEALYKVVSRSLRTYNPEAYTFLRSLQLTSSELMAMLEAWRSGDDVWSVGPRKVVCDWIVANNETWRRWVPLGYPKQVKVVAGSEEVGTACLALGIIGILSSIFCALRIHTKRKSPGVRYSQPNIMIVSVVGSGLVFLAAILFGLEGSDAVCAARPVVLHLGYALLLMPMLLRAYKVSRIINNRKLVVIRIMDADLLRAIGMYLGLIAILIAISFATEGPPVLTLVDRQDADLKDVINRVSLCEVESGTVSQNVVVAVQFLLLLWGVSLAVQTKDTPTLLNESTYIGYFLYSAFVVVGVCAGLLAGLPSASITPRLLAACCGFGSVVVAFAFLIIIVLPKFNPALDNVAPSMSTQSTSANNSGPSPASEERRTSVLEAEVSARDKEIRELRAELEQQQKVAAARSPSGGT